MTPPQPSSRRQARSRPAGRSRSAPRTASRPTPRDQPAAQRIRDALRRGKRTQRVASELERFGAQAGGLRSRAERVAERVRRLV